MISSSSCSLTIRSINLDIEYLESLLNITPSKTIKKGEIISKSSGDSKFNVWVYTVKGTDSENLNDTMKRLLLKFKPLRNEINSISTEAVFRIYVQSDFAQIAFEFESDVIKELAEFNIKLEFSILSWGGVED